MSQLSISAASRLAGVSRTTMYNKYIKSGEISVSRDPEGRKCIDSSELIRLFPNAKIKDSPAQVSSPTYVQNKQPLTPENPVSVQSDPTVLAENEKLRGRVEELEKQLGKTEAREEFYQKQIDTLSSTIKLLEDKREDKQPSRRWWQFMWK